MRWNVRQWPTEWGLVIITHLVTRYCKQITSKVVALKMWLNWTNIILWCLWVRNLGVVGGSNSQALRCWQGLWPLKAQLGMWGHFFQDGPLISCYRDIPVDCLNVPKRWPLASLLDKQFGEERGKEDMSHFTTDSQVSGPTSGISKSSSHSRRGIDENWLAECEHMLWAPQVILGTYGNCAPCIVLLQFASFVY